MVPEPPTCGEREREELELRNTLAAVGAERQAERHEDWEERRVAKAAVEAELAAGLAN